MSTKRGKDIAWNEDWLIDNYYNYPSVTACAEAYNKAFGTNIGRCVVSHKCIKLGLTRGYSEKQVKWLTENYPSIGLKECTELFNNKFNQHRTSEGIRKVLEKNGVKVTTERRQIASSRYRGDDVTPIGTLSIHKGYTTIKVSNDLGKHTDNWVKLHRKVWEDEHGKLEDDEVVIFLDGNKDNCSLENLMAVPKNIQGAMNGYGMFSTEPMLTRASVEWCKLRQALIDNGVNARQLIKENK